MLVLFDTMLGIINNNSCYTIVIILNTLDTTIKFLTFRNAIKR